MDGAVAAGDPGAAASEKVFQRSVTSRAGVSPGSTREEPAAMVADAPKRSEPVAATRGERDELVEGVVGGPRHRLGDDA